MCQSKISTQSLTSLLNAKTSAKTAGAFTVKSNVTGKEYSYKIVAKMWNKKMYLHVSVERQYQEFLYLGVYKDGVIVRKGGVVIDTPSAVAIAYVLKKVEQGKINLLDEQVTLYHFGSCLKCGKTLSDSKSIEYGIGPICRTF